jgi:DNA polymerase-3 subunit epsilon
MEPDETRPLKKTLHDYLAANGGAASTQELLKLIFAGPGDDHEFGRSFLRGLLADDPRFAEEADADRWRVADDHLLDVPVTDAPFVVVDLETTGQRADRAGITEIGAVRVVGRREQGRFDRLVNPGQPIPPYVANLTGITDQMVAGAPPIEELIEEFLAFAGDAVIVAHNAAFDVALLDHECRRILGRPLGLPALCTLKLTHRLLPDVHRASLDGLATHFGLGASGSRHRAMADAELTAGILFELLEVMGADGSTTVGDLLGRQDDPAAPRRLEIRVTQACLERLPDGPGVYWLSAADGECLSVARATRLRTDVTRLFLGAAHLSDRQLRMLCSVVDVGHRETVSELEAALVEAEEIRRRKPTYNRVDRHLPRGSFVKVTRRSPFARVFVASRISDDDALYLGPIKGRGFADEAAATLARLFGLRTCSGPLEPDPGVEPCELGPAGLCTSPCNEAIGRRAYQARVEELEHALAGDGTELRALAARASAAGDGRAKESGIVGRLLRLHKRRHWLVNRHDYVAVVPASGGAMLAVVVIGGRCRRILRLEGERDLDALATASTENTKGRRRRKDLLRGDASTIVTHWIRRRESENEGIIIDLDAGRDLEGSLAAAAAELAAVVVTSE